jgi:plastocyanin
VRVESHLAVQFGLTACSTRIADSGFIFLIHLEGDAMSYDRLRAVPGAIALALLMLIAPRAEAQRVRQNFFRPSTPIVTPNQTAAMNSILFPPRFFNPPFYTTLAAQNPFLLAVGLNNVPFNSPFGFGPNSYLNNVLLANRLLYTNMYGYGGFGNPYAGYGYGGYGGYGYGYPMTYGYGYPAYGYSGGYGYAYSPQLYGGTYASSGYSPAYAGGSYQSGYKSSNGNSYQPQYAGKYGVGSAYSTSPYMTSIAAGNFEIAVYDNSISESKVTIPAGATVLWTNQGKKPHTLTADNESWRSSLPRDGSFSLKFLQPGTYQYHVDAKPHQIEGAIVVK